MIHCVLHAPNDSVAVVVVEGVKAGDTLTGLILDENRTISLPCTQDIPLGHKVALSDLNPGDTVSLTAIDDNGDLLVIEEKTTPAATALDRSQLSAVLESMSIGGSN